MIINPGNRDINPRNWGGYMWTLLHHISYLDTSDMLLDIILCLPDILPCTNCRIHAKQYVSINSPSSSSNLMRYLIDFHNTVTTNTVEGDVLKDAHERKGLSNDIYNIKQEIAHRLSNRLRYALEPFQTYDYDDDVTWNCLYIISITFDPSKHTILSYQVFYDAIADIFGYDLKFDSKQYVSRDRLFMSIYKAHLKDSKEQGYSIESRNEIINNANAMWDKRSVTSSCGSTCSPT